MIENSYIQNSLIILFLPLVAFVIQIFIGKRLPRQGDWISISAIVTTLILSLYMFVSMLQGYDSNFNQEWSFKWINMGSFVVELGVLVDNVTIIMLTVGTLVST